MKKYWLIFIALLHFSSANAALMVFNDRTAWQAAAGGAGDLFEDFDSFTIDTLYGSNSPSPPLTADFLTLTVINGTDDGSWLVDVTPDKYSSLPTVNGTPYATAIGYDVGGGKGDTLMSFANAKAIGFDYSLGTYSTSDGLLTTNLGDSVSVDTLNNQVNIEGVFFLGLLYTSGELFNSLEWSSSLGTGFAYGFGMDNVEAFIAPNPVPVPAAIWLFITGLIGLAGFSERRKVA